MPRYFFHSKDGEVVADHEGAELAGLGEARAAAVQYLTEVLRDAPDKLLETGAFEILVTDDEGDVQFRVAATAA